MAAIPTLKRAPGNNASDTLNGSIAAGDTTLTLNDASEFSANGGMIVIDRGTASEEFIYYESKTGATLTVATSGRGLEGTSAQGHDSGASVDAVITAAQWNDMIDAVVDETSAQTISGVKTFSATPKTDAIAEATVATGVTVDGLLIKDGKLGTNDSVVTANITDANVTTGKLAADAVTQSAVATSTSNTTTTSTSYADLAGATATITTTGGDVLLNWSGIFRNNALGSASFVQFVRDTTALGKPMLVVQAVAGYSTIISMSWVDLAPAAGSTTYKIQWKVNGNTGTCEESMFTVTELKK